MLTEIRGMLLMNLVILSRAVKHEDVSKTLKLRKPLKQGRVVVVATLSLNQLLCYKCTTSLALTSQKKLNKMSSLIFVKFL